MNTRHGCRKTAILTLCIISIMQTGIALPALAQTTSVKTELQNLKQMEQKTRSLFVKVGMLNQSRELQKSVKDFLLQITNCNKLYYKSKNTVSQFSSCQKDELAEIFEELLKLVRFAENKDHAQKDIHQALQKLSSTRKRLVRLKASQDTLALADQIIERFKDFDARLKTTLDADEADIIVQEYRAAGLENNIETMRHLTELTTTIKTTIKKLRTIKQDLTKSANMSARLNLLGLETEDLIADTQEKIDSLEQAQKLVKSGELYAGYLLYQNDVIDDWRPEDMSDLLKKAQGVQKLVGNIKNQELKTRLEDAIEPAGKAAASGNYRGATNTLKQIEAELRNATTILLPYHRQDESELSDQIFSFLESLGQTVNNSKPPAVDESAKRTTNDTNIPLTPTPLNSPFVNNKKNITPTTTTVPNKIDIIAPISPIVGQNGVNSATSTATSIPTSTNAITNGTPIITNPTVSQPTQTSQTLTTTTQATAPTSTSYETTFNTPATTTPTTTTPTSISTNATSTQTNTTNPNAPVFNSLIATNITNDSAWISWTTNVFVTSTLYYAAASSSNFIGITQNALTINNSMNVWKRFMPGTTYKYYVVVTNASGISATSVTQTLTTTGTAPVSDVTAPVISGITISETGTNYANIRWNTNEVSDSKISYGTNLMLEMSTTADLQLVTIHQHGLSGLTAGTTYYFRVYSKDGSGNTGQSNINTLTTTSPVPSPSPATTSQSFVAPTVEHFKWGSNIKPSRLSMRALFKYNGTAQINGFNVYIRKPGQTSPTKYSYSALVDTWVYGSDGTTLYGTQLDTSGLPSWEWTTGTTDSTGYATGDYKFYVSATAADGSEGPYSPEVTSTILPPPTINTPSNGAQVSLPLTINLGNSQADQYYNYQIYNGNTMVYESRYSSGNSITPSGLWPGQNYTVYVEPFDNPYGSLSSRKQKQVEATFITQ